MSNLSKSSEEDLILRVWDGDEAVLGELLMAYAIPIEKAISRHFSGLSNHDVEDVVAEAFQRFWQSRNHYDSSQSLRAYLYTIAKNVANKLVSGHLAWQKTRLLERPTSNNWLCAVEQADDALKEKLDGIEVEQKGICKALYNALNKLPKIERDIIEAYAYSEDNEINSGALGVELGKKHCDGVPIPAGTIRQYKHRAKKKIITEMKNHGYELERTGIRL
tara:strand:- start:3440 stop:4099 length:660 start_codon:yes stop_codon:yes gene_type:complete